VGIEKKNEYGGCSLFVWQNSLESAPREVPIEKEGVRETEETGEGG